MGVLLCLALVLLLVSSSCASDEREEILVFAAASLTDVMKTLGQQFAQSEGVKVRFNLGGSTNLAQQIIRNAPADALILAGPEPMNNLEERGLIASDTRVDLLTNELVVVGRAGVADKMGIHSLEDLASADVRVAIANPDLAPAGWYAREALQNLGLWQRLQPRLVPSLDVRVALGYVETGNVDAGIVYRTDTLKGEGLEILAPIPEESHSPIVYPAGVVGRSRHGEAARKFLEYLRGGEARETFREYGFIPRDAQ